MADHPIQGLMKTAMEQITEMVNVNTIVGDPIETPDGSVIMPISKVGFGFAAGGSEFAVEEEERSGSNKNNNSNGNGNGQNPHNASVALPFGGGSGGGVSITPIAFLVVGKGGVKVVPLDNQTHLYERLIDSAPHVFDKIQGMIKSNTMGYGSSIKHSELSDPLD
jgi:sporulation protein YtfJ